MGARTGLYVPMVARDRALGVIAIHDKSARDPRFTDADQRVVEIFTARASVAVAMSERVARETVRRVVEAQESERRRLALELHDETGQALTSILLGPEAIRAAPTDADAERAETDLRELVVQALQDVRARSPSSSGPRCSTTSGSGLRSSGSRIRSASRRESRRRSRPDSTSGRRLRSRPRSTASCRKR